RAIAMKSENLRARADVTLPGAALRAFAADDMHLGRNVIADGEVLALCALAEALDESAEFVAVDARQRHGIADRRIPMVDVFVCSADRRRRAAHQNFIGA